MTQCGSEVGHLVDGRSRWSGAFFPTLIVVAAILCYANSFKGVFLFDDESAIIDNPSIRSISSLFDVFRPPAETTVSGRPLVNATLAVNYAFGGLSPFGYHLGNLLIHIGAAVLLFGIVRRALRLPKLTERFGRDASLLAFLIALLWTVHPLQTQAVTYIVQRAESLAALFYLATVYSFLRYAEANRSIKWAVAAIFACALGMLAKETMATAPILVLLFDLLLIDRNASGPVRSRAALHGALWTTLVIPVLILLSNPRGDSAGFNAAGVPSSLEYAASQPGVIVHYLRLAFWPTGQCLDYDWPVATSAAAIVPYGLVIFSLLGLTIWAALRMRPIAILGIWFFLILSPTSSIVPVADLAFEHRMYLPLAAVAGVVVLATYSLSIRNANTAIRPRAVRFGVVLLVVAVAFGAMTVQRNRAYHSAVTMWRDVIAKRPRNPRAYHNLGHVLADRGETAAAIESLRQALMIEPDYHESLNYLGVLLSADGNYAEAEELLARATSLRPRLAEYQYNFGIVLARAGHDEAAEKAYRRCLELNSEHADAMYNLGNIELRRRDFGSAAVWFQRAITVRPDHVGANFNLGGILQLRGRQTDAIVRFEVAHAAAMRLAENLEQSGRLTDAIDAYRQAIQARPDDAKAAAALGRLEASVTEARR